MKLLKRIGDKIMKKSGIGKNHRLVGSILWSPYFSNHIIITQVIYNDHWYFKFIDGCGKTYKAGTPLDDMVIKYKVDANGE